MSSRQGVTRRWTEESLGSQLLTAVLSYDPEGAAIFFARVRASQAVRTCHAIDWQSIVVHVVSALAVFVF